MYHKRSLQILTNYTSHSILTSKQCVLDWNSRFGNKFVYIFLFHTYVCICSNGNVGTFVLIIIFNFITNTMSASKQTIRVLFLLYLKKSFVGFFLPEPALPVSRLEGVLYLVEVRHAAEGVHCGPQREVHPVLGLLKSQVDILWCHVSIVDLETGFSN